MTSWARLLRVEHRPEDIHDVEAYVAANPAVGHTVSADDIRTPSRGCPTSRRARAYGNIFTQALHDPVVPLERWLSLEDPDSSIASGLVLAARRQPGPQARQHRGRRPPRR